ncbi:MAG: hypothetical protein ACLRFJ_01870 [Alphaproteobacteria bacterium]
MVDFKEIIAVEGLYLPDKKGEAYGADILIKRGVFTLLVRYQYQSKGDANRAVAALKAQNADAMPKTNLPKKVFMVDLTKVR